MSPQSARRPRRTRASATTVPSVVNVSSAALGFRAHSGWAALVAVAGPVESPTVIDRRRIELADPKIARPAQPYHWAREMGMKEAAQYLSGFEKDCWRLAAAALRDELDHLQKLGHQVVNSGLPVGSGRLPDSLAAILASHPALHTAEGELFRTVILRACEALGVPLLTMGERYLLERGAKDFSTTVRDLENRLAELGKSIGPPWGQDQKIAALIGWMALAAAK